MTVLKGALWPWGPTLIRGAHFANCGYYLGQILDTPMILALQSSNLKWKLLESRVFSSMYYKIVSFGTLNPECMYSRYSMHLPCFWFLDGRYKYSWTNFVLKRWRIRLTEPSHWSVISSIRYSASSGFITHVKIGNGVHTCYTNCTYIIRQHTSDYFEVFRHVFSIKNK